MNLPWYAFFIRLLPESLLYVLAGYGIVKKKLEMKEYLISSLLLALIIYFVKLLPLSLLIPQIIILLCCILLKIFINKIDAINAIISTISVMIIIIILEGINMVFINLLLKDSYHNADPFIQMMLGLPSLIVLSIIIIFYYIKRLKRAEKYDALQKNC